LACSHGCNLNGTGGNRANSAGEGKGSFHKQCYRQLGDQLQGGYSQFAYRCCAFGSAFGSAFGRAFDTSTQLFNGEAQFGIDCHVVAK